MMKNIFIVVPLVFLCCFTVACHQGERVRVEPIGSIEADIQAIKDIIEGWNAAQNAGDVGGKMSHVADDMVLIPPNAPEIVGKQAIQNNHQQLSNLFTFQEEDDVVNVHVSGDLAVAHVAWSSVVIPKTGDDSFTAIVNVDKNGEAKIESVMAEGQTKKLNGNWIIVFEKQPDGAWNCIYSFFSDESLGFPTQEE